MWGVTDWSARGSFELLAALLTPEGSGMAVVLTVVVALIVSVWLMRS